MVFVTFMGDTRDVGHWDWESHSKIVNGSEILGKQVGDWNCALPHPISYHNIDKLSLTLCLCMAAKVLIPGPTAKPSWETIGGVS